MSSPKITVTSSTRIQAQSTKQLPRTVPLSLLDATTAEFALTSAIWLFDRPRHLAHDPFDLTTHLSSTLSTTLVAYPHWAGQIKAIQTVDGVGPEEAAGFPAHARRFGRIFAQFGYTQDPGVDFSVATCPATLDELYPAARRENQTFWNSQNWLDGFISPVAIATAFQPDLKDSIGFHRPVMAIQVTMLACGGFVLAAKIAHPLADITALVAFMKDWASTSRAAVSRSGAPTLRPVFDPAKLDAFASGSIDFTEPDPKVLQRSAQLPMNRYDWWLDTQNCPWPISVPEPFHKDKFVAAGTSMPWSEWDVSAPVSSAIVRLSSEQVDFLWARINEESSQRLSHHDAVLSHIWSSINRARNLGKDHGTVHCELVYSVRQALQLGDNFIGSPIIIINIETSGAETAGEAVALGSIATRIRETIGAVGKARHICDHLYSVAYEKSPQRIWQAFLGNRHILVTTWARAGIYDIDFGVGSSIRYADGVVPDMDGLVVIKEAPPTAAAEASTCSWTKNGVDVSIHIRTQDMERLLEDPLLFPPGKQQSG